MTLIVENRTKLLTLCLVIIKSKEKGKTFHKKNHITLKIKPTKRSRQTKYL